MSLKKIGEVKSSKWFVICDIVAYAAIALAILTLILVYTLKRNRSELEGFCVTYKGTEILSFKFSDSFPKSNKYDGEYIEVGETTEEGFYIKFSDGEGFNEIFVNTKEHTVSVVESNCSSHKDCVYTQPLTSNSSIPIICTVHSLVISPLSFKDDGVIKT